MLDLWQAATMLNWGSVPDWGAAVGTIGAVIFTLRSADAAGRQRLEDDRALNRASARAVLVNLGEILNDLMGLRRSFLDNVGTIHVFDEAGHLKEVEFYKPGLGVSALIPFNLEERQLALLERDPAISGSYRLALRRHRAHIAAINEYAKAISNMKDLREVIRAEQSLLGQQVQGHQHNLRLRAENVRSLGDELYASISQDIVDGAKLADRVGTFIKPLFGSRDFPHLDTESLRSNPTYPVPEAAEATASPS